MAEPRTYQEPSMCGLATQSNRNNDPASWNQDLALTLMEKDIFTCIFVLTLAELIDTG